MSENGGKSWMPSLRVNNYTLVYGDFGGRVGGAGGRDLRTTMTTTDDGACLTDEWGLITNELTFTMTHGSHLLSNRFCDLGSPPTKHSRDGWNGQ